ncbi:MAG: M23 family metallopeptidase [Acidobacteriota bacterium]|jgi:murein DD-endopeptidase MepM/ murein hydrolase activator NlpD|nr:M23 family metallopeptidase [Acidobacteriota bacterium]
MGRLREYISSLFPLFILWACLLLPAAVGDETAAPYQSPLKRHNGFSSSFQDFRSSHFHGGVDFRTFQRTGLPVVAITDGHVVTLRMVRRGSGRGIYLRHQDGNISLYFHLERFAPGLEEILKQWQQRKRTRYVGNIDLSPPVPVRAGELLGYSGETGSGFPHLHLEIRDSAGARLNPFPLVRAGFKDDKPPQMHTLILRTRADGVVNGAIGEIRVPLRREQGDFVPAHPIIIMGGVDAVSGGRDISDSGRPVAPARVRAWLDERKVFELRFSRFTWADNNQLGFVYDMHDSTAGNFFFNLFSQPGFSLEQTGLGLSRALAECRPGSHRVLVEWQDQFGNACLGRIPVEIRQRPELSFRLIGRGEKRLLVEISALNAPGADRVDLVALDDSGLEISTLPLKPVQQLPLQLQIAEPQAAKVLEVRFLCGNTVYAVRRMSVASASPPLLDDIDPGAWIAGDSILIHLREPALGEKSVAMRVAVADSNWKPPAAVLDGLVFTFAGSEVDAVSSAPDHLFLLQCARMENGSPRSLIQKTLRVIRLVPGEETRFQWNDFSARFAAGSVREPRLLLAEKRFFPAPFPCLSSQVELRPGHFAFLDQVDYTITCRVPNPRQAALFRWDDIRGKWHYVSTRFDRLNHRYTTRVRVSGTYALLRDNRPPRISFSRSSQSSLPLITITDEGTGLDDLSLQVRVNQQVMDAEYDPDRHRVIFFNPPQLQPGTHQIRVECRDRAWNHTERTWSWKNTAGGGKNG